MISIISCYNIDVHGVIKFINWKYFPILVLLLTNIFFFNPFWLKGLSPFPGDLLLAEYGPWKNYSFLGFAPGGIPNKGQSFDTIRQLYPWRYLAIDSIKNGQWPLWNPYNFSGTPLLANFQSAVFNPLNLLFFILPFNFVWSVQVMLQPLLASIFFFLFIKKLKLSTMAALIGSIAWGYCSFMTVWLEYNTIGHVIAWLPLVLYSIEPLLKSIRYRYISLLILSLTISLFGGHIQDFVVLFLFSEAYLFYRIIIEKEGNFALWLKIFVFSLIPFLFSAIQLLPGIELILNSARSPLNSSLLVNSIFLKPWQLIFAFIPDYFGNPASRNYFLSDTYIGKVLYIGIIPIILSFYSIFNLKNFKVRFFLIVGLLTLFLTIVSPITIFIYNLPLLSSVSPTRILFIFQFCFIVLAVFGFDCFLKLSFKKQLIPVIAIGIIFIIAGIFASDKINISSDFINHLNVVRRNYIYSTGLSLIGILLLLIIKLPKIKQYLPYLIIGFIVFDLFRFFQKITPFSSPQSIYPETEVTSVLASKGIDRYWSYGTATINSNYNGIYNLYSSEGYDPLYSRQYGEFIRSAEDGKIKPAIRSDANLPGGFGRDNFQQNYFRKRILELTNTKYILDRTENLSDLTTFPINEFSLIWSKDDWRIFENKNVAPRIYFPTRLITVSDTKSFEDILFNDNFKPGQDAIIISSKDIQQTYSQGKVDIVNYSANKIKLAVISTENQPLVISDSFFPGWLAEIDGTKIPIGHVNYAYRLVNIPSGKHQVEITYQPISFKIGLIISLISVSGWLLAGIFTIIKRRSDKLTN